MKVRNGFVSNSSSASFVVVVREFSWETKSCERKISAEQERKLLDFGFQYTKGYPPYILRNPGEIVNSPEDFAEKDNISLCFDVICNEEEVAEVLFRNKIPFMAMIQNGEFLQVYDGKSDFYEMFTDYVNHFLTYRSLNQSAFDMFKYMKPYYKEKIGGDAKEELNIGDNILLFQEELEEVGKEAQRFFSEEELKKMKHFIYEKMNKRLEKLRKINKNESKKRTRK